MMALSLRSEAITLEHWPVINADDVALGTDPKRLGESGAGEIDGDELAPAFQKTVGRFVGARVKSCDVAATVDPPGQRADGAGEIDRREGAAVRQRSEE